MSDFPDLLGGPDPVRLPGDPAATAALAAGTQPELVAAAHPADSLAWAVLAEEAFAGGGRTVTAYAYARTGYHRGLDALRRAGWKGYGPVPWSHEPNRGFLRALAALGRAAETIAEADEAARVAVLLDDCDPLARTETA